MVIENYEWIPKRAQNVINCGATSWIARYNDDTVLKYPVDPPKESRGQQYAEDTEEVTAVRDAMRKHVVDILDVERRILQLLGSHPRIIALRPKTHPDGLLLEYIPNGRLDRHLDKVERSEPTPSLSIGQRLKWARQAAEAVAYIHSKNVIHCDLGVHNLMLTANLDIKLIDFQSRLLASDGTTVVLNGGAGSCALAQMPRPDKNRYDAKTDLFSMGTTMFHIMTGSLPFTDLDTYEDAEEVERRFREAEYPRLDECYCGEAIRKCWMGLYQSADALVKDLECLEKRWVSQST